MIGFDRVRAVIQSIGLRIRSAAGFDNKPGLYVFMHESSGYRNRIHLRIDPDGSGILLINANRILHLNPSAAFMARLALEQSSDDQAILAITRRYRVPKGQATSDYTQFTSNLSDLLDPDGPCPIHDMELEIRAPFSSHPSAPYRMDLALTYRCNNECDHCYNARPRTTPELSTDQWKVILDQLWSIGIPHVVFTGGEPTLRNDLPQLISHAQNNGQITGLNTNGRRLSNSEYVNSLVEAGLDHVQITIESHDPLIHDAMVNARGAWNQSITGLQNALESPLYVMTNTTLLQQNSQKLEETLQFLAGEGVPTVGLNALIYSGRGKNVGTGIPDEQLPPLLETARRITDEKGQRLIWYTPTQYCHFDPMQLELGVKGCTAALYNMCIEPDGIVIPCQSYYQSLGNIQTEPWEKIWNHPLCLSLRERKYIADKCLTCPLLQECGGGCPLKTSD